MKQGGYLPRRTPLKKRNPSRLAKRRAGAFGPQAEACRAMGCCCGCGTPPPSDPAHVRSRGASGKDWRNVVPLARGCHMLQHAIGTKRFEKRKKINLQVIASEIADDLEARGVTS